MNAPGSVASTNRFNRAVSARVTTTYSTAFRLRY